MVRRMQQNETSVFYYRGLVLPHPFFNSAVDISAYPMRGIIMKNLEYYMSLPYNKIIQEVNDESGHYFYGKIMELDGCQSTGDTLEELNTSLAEAMEGHIEVMLENEMEIPEPIKEENLSGKFVIRVPKSLHRRLVIEAEREGVSLNQYAMYKLAK